jgi:hypothetical protein
MKLEVTRDVVSDLWPLYETGEASMESRALVDAFLAEDRSFAETLLSSQKVPRLMPAVRLSPDGERRLLDDARERAQTTLLVRALAIVMVGLVLLAIIGAGAFLAFNRP